MTLLWQSLNHLIDINSNLTQTREIIYLYEGPCTAKVIQDSVDRINELFPDDQYQGMAKRLSSAAIEMIQNIGFYSEEKSVIDGELIGIGTFLIRKENKKFIVETRNRISPEKFEKFRIWIEKLNFMSKDELKQLRKEFLKNGALPGSRGANIGLIDIIRKNESPVHTMAEEFNGSTYLITTVQFPEE